MGVAEHLAGQQLRGKRGNLNWTVLERISQQEEDRSGLFYSIGYRVRCEDGREAFMKVTDLDLLTDSSAGFVERTRAALQAHDFERSILDHCRGNNMDRVVIALDYGDAIVNCNSIREPIFYLMFELAECDVRVQVNRQTRFDLAWILGALHDLSVAIQQLHSGQVSHNDIKPPNLLVFKDRLQKLADLGCATSPLIVSIYDEAMCIGDDLSPVISSKNG